MTLLHRRREPPPRLWQLFCTEWLRLSSTKTDQWWQALQQARWSRATELRSSVLCRAALPHTRTALEHLVRHNLQPTVLILTLEDLIHEQVMSPLPARRIEEHVLAKTNQH